MGNPFDSETFPTTEPDSVVMGQFVGWRTNDDFDAADYTLQYTLTPIGATNNEHDIVVMGEQDGEYWNFTIDSAASSAFTITEDTEYRWDLIVNETSSSNSASIRSGFTRIFTSSSDRRTHAEIMVVQINALLEGRAKNDVSSYSIKSRSLTKMSVEELITWRSFYLDEVRRTGGSVETGKRRINKNTVQVGFV